jgi:hypothetical protein
LPGRACWPGLTSIVEVLGDIRALSWLAGTAEEIDVVTNPFNGTLEHRRPPRPKSLEL